MLTYNLDIEPGSLWLRATPGEFALSQPFFCTEAGIFYAREQFNTIRDFKDSYLLFCTIEGCGIINQSDVTVHLRPGQALFMNCRSSQSYFTDPESGKWTHYWMHIDGSGIKGMESLLIPEGRITALHTSADTLKKEYDLLLRNLENTSSNTILSTSLSIHKILSSLVFQNSISYSQNQKLIQKSADYIHSHFSESFELDTLLEIAGMSRSYFMRQFRQYMGTTPYSYLLSLRITKAREYLEVTDMTIHEIAAATGFSDDPSFSTRFSSMVGMSPLKYRKEFLSSHQMR